MADRIVRMGVGLFVGVWIARYLGPARFGSLNFALSYVAIFGSLTTFVWTASYIREIVRASKNTLGILGSTLALGLGGSLLALLASVISIKFLEPV
jgi:polysaccharide transporter, PST family